MKMVLAHLKPRKTLPPPSHSLGSPPLCTSHPQPPAEACHVLPHALAKGKNERKEGWRKRLSHLPLLFSPILFPAVLRPEKTWLSCTSYNRNIRSFLSMDSQLSCLRQGLHGHGDIPVSSGSTAQISSKRAREDGTGG